MNYQSNRQDKHLFKPNSWKISNTHDAINQLQKKMYSHFDHKQSQEEQLINSSSQNVFNQQQQTLPNKNNHIFKIYGKTHAVSQPPQQQENKDISIVNTKYNLQTNKKTKGQAMQLIQQVEAIEILVRKKLKLKQQKNQQIQRQILLETQQKVHLFRLNCQLQQQLQSLIKEEKAQQKYEKQQQQALQSQLKRLKKQHAKVQAQNKRLRKQEQLLRQSLKQSQNGRREYIQCELKSAGKNKVVKRQNQEIYLRGLVIQLDKLKKMVRSKMKESKSKPKLKINSHH